ncbi:hypothetical protein L210DRAFT_3757996 [Boletus edulis BED1]|uniref:UBC core domain-containing protein n=1 Tax=Boletus edulis BED1 TaxID=1328754 RepID=A0AAD4C0Y7_BOLED|nr:hypothetical protein L210DRAFT_3757996 [Boletus edulis BED1]
MSSTNGPPSTKVPLHFPARRRLLLTPTIVQFYQEDIVRRIGWPNAYGVVLRCWHDAEDLPPVPNPLSDPLMRPLTRGEVGVSFLPGGLREIVPESEYELVDRTFQAGDYCKRSLDDVRSGVVVSTHVQARLVHAISGVPVNGRRDVRDLRHATTVNAGDYVTYDDWIGQVIELFDELVISASGTLIRMPEISSRLTIGDKGLDILPHPLTFHGIHNMCQGTPIPSVNDTVVDLQHTVLAICWLALNQTVWSFDAFFCSSDSISQLDRDTMLKKRRPERFWHGEDLTKLTVLRTKSGDIRVGDKVTIPDDETIPIVSFETGIEGNGKINSRTLCVQETRTTVVVLWQDGSRATLPSTDLIPYLNVDEYDCWPGDHVLWKNEDQERVATVQSVNSTDRVAVIRCADTGTLETVSVLELDPNGTGDASPDALHGHGFGVRRGDSVFIHPVGTTNGFAPPRVPKIGEIEEWVREPPVRADGELSGWRRTMADLGALIAANRNTHRLYLYDVSLPSADDTSLTWFGEVTELHLNGSVEVTYPNMEVSVLPLERLTRLYDSLEQIEDDGWDEEASERDSNEEYSEGIWLQDAEGIWRYEKNSDDDEWEEMDEDPEEMDVDLSWAETESSPGLDDDSLNPPPSVTALDLAESVSPLPTSPSTSPEMSQESVVNTTTKDTVEVDDDSLWRRFEILPSAPTDHAFYSTSANQPSRTFLARLTKEYRALSNSLPDSIIVRAYEDRSDLLRCLIIGPENTPYEDAPFVIDWMLDSNFPQSPPIAHFLSWTNGNGRVNPNLYEEGKVCLSILGTWSGDRTETWSASRSSLLQAFVSIQGLVLVKEPWFCEPAYEKLRGTEEGMVNSRLYSEKAYVLSRGFVRRALDIPLGGLQSEINWLYYTKGRLGKVLNNARQLIEKSKNKSTGDSDQDLAVSRLTAGGIITLERTLGKLQLLLERNQATGTV